MGLCLSFGDHRKDECVINRIVLAFDSSSPDGMCGAREHGSRRAGARGAWCAVRVGQGVGWPVCRLGGGSLDL
jgi:hypothetical protein